MCINFLIFLIIDPPYQGEYLKLTDEIYSFDTNK